MRYALAIVLLIWACSKREDYEIPPTPLNVQAIEINQTSVILRWDAVKDVSHYIIFLNDTINTTTVETEIKIKGLNINERYSFFLKSSDNISLSKPSNIINVQTLNECEFSNTIFPELQGSILFEKIRKCFSPTNILSYSTARDEMYSKVDKWEDGLTHTIYANFTISISDDTSPRSQALNMGVNAEHLFPQSMGAGKDPARSDIHNLFSCKENINNYRGNKPYGEIIDINTDRWYYGDTIIMNNIPNNNINLYSEGNSSFWEPREEIKGDVARSIFYFYVIYNDVVNEGFFNSMKEDLIKWNVIDPPSKIEFDRNKKVKTIQGNDNPFILDSSLAERLNF